MKFQMLGAWPGPGNVFIEAGAVIDGQQFPWPLPPNAKALDQEALDALAFWYGQEHRHLIHFAPGLHLAERYQPPPAPQRKDKQ
jgi:hypothetical protein